MSGGVLVRYGVTGETHDYDPADLALACQDRVVVETDFGQRLGTVLEWSGPPRPGTPKVLRRATKEDLDVARRHAADEQEALKFARECVGRHGLAMRLVGAEIIHTGTRTLLYFVSDERVDFRALVKDLARRFHTRIELRQIGVRDAARHTGGVGLCGRELCCSTWIPEFRPVSLRMAKDQGLAQNHEKLAGLCGRLRCCLAYEHDNYTTAPK